MTDDEAKEILLRPFNMKNVPRDILEAHRIAIKALDQISHLKDRPCEACEFYTEKGCSKWECVFEGNESEE